MSIADRFAAARTASAAGSPPASSSPPTDIEAQARSDWQRDPAIRAEFGEEKVYVAFRRAEAAGKVRILGGRVHGGRP